MIQGCNEDGCANLNPQNFTFDDCQLKVARFLMIVSKLPLYPLYTRVCHVCERCSQEYYKGVIMFTAKVDLCNVSNANVTCS